ncbi:MAG: hypothetical protein ACJAYR_001177 [Sneathiella sp.]|jgi:hypothetical protein
MKIKGILDGQPYPYMEEIIEALLHYSSLFTCEFLIIESPNIKDL